MSGLSRELASIPQLRAEKDAALAEADRVRAMAGSALLAQAAAQAAIEAGRDAALAENERLRAVVAAVQELAERWVQHHEICGDALMDLLGDTAAVPTEEKP